MSTKSGIWLLPMMVIISVLAAGCGVATLSPTPIPSTPTSILPSPTTAPTDLPPPTGSAPLNRVPAIKNYSLVTGSVEKVVPDSSNPSFLRLTLKVTSTSHVENYPSFTDDKVGQEIDILIDATTLAGTVGAGKTVQVKVSYRGDERGGNFYGSEITFLPQ